ncbi:tumor necrosis factor ligand superfamily member 14 [Gouania willdenowi]|uniref:tumor necrosis factor ligand superfamily member 14 n=1 Tax=Gouania willdenowi TaxID=441366 RepID=UPI001055E77B|nr:tumor necrosis factor ligand superfamily member 14-like [Gouania willdenowi]
MSQSSHRVRTKEMAEGGGPPVFMVDTYGARAPPVPKRERAQRSCGVAQVLLFILVTLALCGLVVEAFFIYSLHQSKYQDSCAMSSKQVADEDVFSATKPRLNALLHQKPAAHLAGGPEAHQDQHVMGWNVNGEPLLHEIDYENKRLVIQKEGYYFIYSKVFFTDSDTFYHSVQKHTVRYAEHSISLLLSRNYSPPSNKYYRQNSFLGGVFYLEKHDALFVNVTNTQKVVVYQAMENVFGAFML